MRASLMMYARPELESATARYWSLLRTALRDRGVETPTALSNDAPPFDIWQAPDLVLSQTCGMPFVLKLADQVQLVGTPDYQLEGCPPGYYRSALVVREDDARSDLWAYKTARLAYNDRMSQSGFSAAYAATKEAGFWFSDQLKTGGHVASARAVADGAADIAAIDAMTWRLIRRYDGFAKRLRVLCYSKPTPGLPYITGPAQSRLAVAKGVREAIAALDAEDRAALSLHALMEISKEDYLKMSFPPAEV